jgi:ABC-type nitrate/sulfonate/bicarbonate transport system permease component
MSRLQLVLAVAAALFAALTVFLGFFADTGRRHPRRPRALPAPRPAADRQLVSALPIIGVAPIMVMWFGFDWQSKAPSWSS